MRTAIQNTTVKRAKSDAAAGVRREIQDVEARGLVLRVQPSGCVWQVRLSHERKDYRVTVGSVDVWTLALARQITPEIRWHVTSGYGVPSVTWIDVWRRRAIGEIEKRAGPPVEAREERVGTWTYRQAVDAWVAWLEAEVAAGNLTSETVRNYRGAVTAPVLRDLNPRLVSKVSVGELAGAVDRLVGAGKRSQAKDVVRVSKRFWKWLSTPARESRSGVKPGALDRLEAPKVGSVKGRQHYPELAEVATVLAIARAGILDPTVAAAVELLVWTAQRRLTIVRAKPTEFEPWSEREGWGLWRASHRKTPRARATGKPHVVPLPPSCWGRLVSYLSSLPRDAEWAFPQVRERRAGAGVGHLSADTLTHTPPTFPGVQATPHDLRRAMASSLQDAAGLHASVVGMVLDHARDETTRDNVGITRRYTEAEMLGWKTPVMQAWATLLDVAVAEVVLPPVAELKAGIARKREIARGAKQRPARKAA